MVKVSKRIEEAESNRDTELKLVNEGLKELPPELCMGLFF